MKTSKARMAAATSTSKAKMVSMRAPITMSAAAKEGEPHGPATFEGVLYSGGVIPRWAAVPPLQYDYVVDLAGMTASRKPTANFNHDTNRLVGHVSEHQNDGKQLHIKGVLSYPSVDRDAVVKSHDDGFDWEVSTEADLRNFRLLKASESAVVNGQTFTGPLFIARKSKFTGLAFCPEGADDGNSIRIAASAAGEPTMNEFEAWLVANDFDLDTITDKQRTKMQAAYDLEKNPPAVRTTSKPGQLSALAKAERDENDRQTAIAQMSQKAMKENPHLIDSICEMAQKAIDEKWTNDKFELEVLRGTRMLAGSIRPHSTHEPNAEVIEAALCRAAGMPNLDKHFSEQVLDAVDKDPRMKHFSLQQCLMRCAVANGYDAGPGERITSGNLKRVLRYAFPDDDGPGRGDHRMRAAGYSTISLPGIFANAGNKELLAGFTEEDQTWREISRIASLTNFMTATSYRLNDSLEYDELPPMGDIHHGTLSEESYTRQLKTYAKMLGLSRPDIINDDLSAFDDLRTRLGRGGARKFNNVFWAAYMNNASFFTTARGNYLAGATTNLGVDGVGLTQGVSLFKRLESADGKRIGGQPIILMVPPELEYIADQLYTGGNPPYQTVANTNPFAGKYKPLVVPWLSDSAFTGFSTTAWYLFRAPSILAPMVVSFLNGNQQPTVESADADFDTLGILFRGYWDFATDQAEYLSGVKLKGAA